MTDITTDLGIAQMLVNLYAGAVGFDHYEPGSGDSGICWALKRMPDADVICLRGSACFEDWIRNLIVLATPFSHAAFGPVHPGFEMGLERAFPDILDAMGHNEGPVIVAGHSLGAGRAAILSALFIESGNAPVGRVVFGEPKPGFAQLASYISKVPARSYRNADGKHHDLITDVPLSFPPEEYVHASELIDVCAPPSSGDRWGIFAYHHMELYVQALKGSEA